MSQPIANGTSAELSQLKEENSNLRREIEALIQAKEIAKEKVRSAIQELVDENKKLKQKVSTLEAQVSSLLAERNGLLKRLSNAEEPKRTKSGEIGKDGVENSEEDGAIPASSSPLDRSKIEMRKSDGAPVRTTSPMRRHSQAKLAKVFGVEEDVVHDEAQKIPEALTIEEDGLIMMRNENDNTLDIRGGTLEKLVQRLYHETTPKQAPDFVVDFVLTHTAFATPEQVINLLTQKYIECVEAESKEPTASQGESEFKRIRLRICNVFEQWIELQPENLNDEKFKEFVKTKVAAADGARIAKTLTKKLARSAAELGLPSTSSPSSSSSSSPSASTSGSSSASSSSPEDGMPGGSGSKKTSPRSSSPRPLRRESSSTSPAMLTTSGKVKAPKSLVPRNSKVLSLDDVEAVELARQMTLLDYELFQRIRPCEYNNLAWTKKNKESLSPNLLRMIRRFNEVSIWVQSTIVNGKSVKKRAAIVDKFVKIAQAFRKLNNFNGVMQIISAMEAAAVHRLNKTIERVRLKNRNKYAELHELMSGTSSYKYYREALGAATPPCIPYMGMYLTDLMTLEEMHKNTLEPQHPNWINFTKRVQIATLMKTIIEQQSGEYCLLPVECVREWILAQLEQHGNTTEEELFKLSLIAEPREE